MTIELSDEEAVELTKNVNKILKLCKKHYVKHGENEDACDSTMSTVGTAIWMISSVVSQKIADDGHMCCGFHANMLIIEGLLDSVKEEYNATEGEVWKTLKAMRENETDLDEATGPLIH